MSTSTPFPLGVFEGIPDEASFDSSMAAFDSLMGTSPAYMNAYVDPNQAIQDWVSNAGFSASVFAASSYSNGTIPTIGLPMASSAEGQSADQQYQNFAAGDYDGVLQGMVKAWADQGFTTQYWRPGVEMNLTGSLSYAGDAGSSQQSDWIAAFQHIYTVLHAAAAADGVDLKVVWNPGVINDSPAGSPIDTLYPGNQYVDVIGADVYGDAYPYGDHSALYDWDKSGQQINSPNPVYDSSVQEWASDPVNLEHYYTDPASDQYALDGSGGNAVSLQNLIDFAKAQGKPIAIAETGAGNSSDGAGLSDNPTFVQWLSSTLTSSGVEVDYVSIWNSNSNGTYDFTDGDKPQEAAAWAKYFGADSGGSSSSGSTSSGSTSGGSTSSGSTSGDGDGSTGTTTSGSSGDTLALQVSEDYGNGDAQFTVSVDGEQVGGVYTADTLHSSGDAGTFLLTGDWGSGAHDVQVSFINDANGATPGTDRNLYVNSVAYDGTTYAGTTATMLGNGTSTFAVGSNAAQTSGPSDTLTVNLSEDALNGDAQFVLYIDGKAISSPQSVTALHDQNATQAFSFSGNFGAGTHTIGVGFVNDAYISSGQDRNLYINGVTLNGSTVFSGVQGQYSNGVSNFAVTTSS